jgi:SAM-dependent methyltransferase
VQLDRGYTDPDLVAAYDAENSGRDDIEFYLALAAELGAGTVADVGCGTGVLAADLAARGHAVLGVDPSAQMLDVARRRPGGNQVTWIDGDASALAGTCADLVVMTGHVAQVFLGADDWAATLGHIADALRPGGHLAFESRNPSAQGWRRWTRDGSFGQYRLPDGRAFSSWVEVAGAEPGFVEFDAHTVYDGADPIVSTSRLRFRTLEELTESVQAAGLDVVAVYGDWTRGPVTTSSPELILLGRRR